jgi:excinuclease ABC subunit B
VDDLDVVETIRDLEKEMIEAAEKLEFEKAALLRDQVSELKNLTGERSENTPKQSAVTYLLKKKTKQKN